MTETEKRWTVFAREKLLGKRITNVRYLSESEAQEIGWHSRSIVFGLDDGSIFFVSADDEGNDAGALFGQDAGGDEITIPVL